MSKRSSVAVLGTAVLASFLPAHAVNARQAEPTLDALRSAAQARMQQDRATYGPAQVKEIEDLYQTANKDLKAPGATDTLKQLIHKYPKSNRAGCAALYLAQMSSGADREAYLKKAVADHSDARYGDGTQVGAFGRALLATYYANAGRTEDAQRVAAEVTKLFPGAVDHSGVRLADTLRRMKLVQ
jgi:hypothetical protein